MISLTFSISVPVYKQDEFIKTALESLRVQTEKFELAVLDATPNDSIQNILKNYQDMITYQYHHKDEGQSAAIQEGWDNTHGEIVAWLNADDYYYPDTLSKVAKVFNEHPEVDVVYGHSKYIDAQGNFLRNFPAISEDISLITKLNIICQPSCFVRRKAMEKIKGLNKNLHYTMDWDLWIRLYQAGFKFYFLNEILSVVREYSETKTMSGSKERYKEIEFLLKPNTSWWYRKKIWVGYFLDNYNKKRKEF